MQVTTPITLEDLWSALGAEQRRAAEALWTSADPKIEEERDRVEQKLARAMNFRPQFIRKAKAPEKVKWLLAKIGTTELRDERELLVRTWLLSFHAPIVEAFLNALKIPHKGGLIEGEVSPPTPAEARNAVEQLAAAKPALAAAAYLGYLCIFPIGTLEPVPAAVTAANIDLRAMLGSASK